MIAIDEVHIWQIDLTLPLSPAWAASLDAAEQARAARYATATLQLAFRRARGALRAVLAHYTGRPAGDLRLVPGTWGKPALANGELEFNLSHSGSLALLAVAPPHSPVGIDIESLDQRRIDVATLFDMTCHDSEKATLASLSGDAQRQAFFALWTRKEAYLKALGVGLQADLRTITFEQCPLQLEHHWSVTDHAAHGKALWQVRSLETAAGYAASVCLPKGGMRVVWSEAAGVLGTCF